MGQRNKKAQMNCFWAQKVSQIIVQLARIQLDAASNITIISHTPWMELVQPSITEKEKSATSASAGTVKLKGRLHCCVSFIKTPSIMLICLKNRIDRVGTSQVGKIRTDRSPDQRDL